LKNTRDSFFNKSHDNSIQQPVINKIKNSGMKVNMKEWKEQALSSKKRLAIPIMTHPGIDLIGKRVIDAVTNGHVHSDAILALNERYPAAAATIIMDLTVEAEAFGSAILFSDHEVPSVSGRLVGDIDEVERLKVPGMNAGRIQQYLLATSLASRNIASKPVFAGCIGPFSLAGRLFDMTEIMTAAYIEPDTILMLLEKCTKFLIEYVKELKQSGANGIIMAEPAAGLLTPDMCQQFSSDFIKTIVDLVQDDSFLFILHNCGNTGHVTQQMINTGAGGLHFGNKIDMVQVCNEVPSDILVLGNLDPVADFKMASPSQMRERTISLLEKTSEFINFVLSSGCDTPPQVPIENIEAFYIALNEFNK
jgi:uroporphyrinogen decarboxylase